MDPISWGTEIPENTFKSNAKTYDRKQVTDFNTIASIEIMARDAVGSILIIFSKYHNEKRITRALANILDYIHNGLATIKYNNKENVEWLNIFCDIYSIDLKRENRGVWWCNSLKATPRNKDYAAPVEILKGQQNKFTYISCTIDNILIA